MGLAIVRFRSELGRLAHKSSPKFFSSAKRERQIFYVYCGMKASERAGFDLFPLQKIASSDSILARTICVPVACQTGWSWDLLPEPEMRSEDQELGQNSSPKTVS